MPVAEGHAGVQQGNPVIKAAESEIAKWLDVFVVLLVSVVTIAHFIRAARSRLWFDELLAAAVVDWKPGVLDALRAGADAQPPLFYWLTKAFSIFSSDPHIALRLGSLLGVPVTLCAVYVFTKRGAGPLAGAIAVCVIALTSQAYALDARPYSMQLAFTALGVLVWQQSLRDNQRNAFWTVLLGGILVIVSALHFYGFLLVLPFAVAEAVRAFQSRRINWISCCAIALPLAVPVIHLPLIRFLREMYSATFWSKPSPLTIARCYLAVVPLTVCGVVLLATALDTWLAEKKRRLTSHMSRPELALIGTFLLYPLIMYLFSSAVKGGFTERYCWPTVIGCAIAVGVMVSGGLGVVAGRTALIAMVALLSIENYSNSLWQPSRPLFAFAAEARKAGEHLPIAVNSLHDYLLFLRYLPADSGPFVYVVDFERAVRYMGHDTGERNLFALRKIRPDLRLDSTTSFLDANQSFLLYTSGIRGWLENYLRSGGYEVTKIGERRSENLYLVRAK